ncbi:MAG: sulfur carrier protein ThiS [Bacteroidia bacterium]|jgi:sulfur carrier protein|nr:sulfur carrier protein ThiS [Bacteroidia bacterium]
MEITVNHISKQIPSDSTLTAALQDVVNAGTKGIAVAVNSTVVQKAKWNECKLKQGDSITVIKATQGG